MFAGEPFEKIDQHGLLRLELCLIRICSRLYVSIVTATFSHAIVRVGLANNEGSSAG